MSEAIRFTTRLERRDVLRAGALLLLRHPASILMMAAGPVFWLTGIIGSAAVTIDLGMTLMPLVVGVPAVALLVGSGSAYRPGSSELYDPVDWTFGDESIDLAHSGRHARAEWDEFRSWRTAAGSYLLYTTRTRYLVLPLRDVPVEVREGFEELLTSHLGPRHR